MPATLSGFMNSRISVFFILINLLASGCYRNHFYVQQEWIDRNYLASVQVGTPDPRKESPPSGQQLLVGWDFPKSIFDQGLTLVVTIRLWDSTQKVFSRPMIRKRGYEVFFFPSKGPGSEERILTYYVKAVAQNGEVVGYWEHQFWTDLIEIGSRQTQEES